MENEDEYVIRVRFVCETGDYKDTPLYYAKQYLDGTRDMMRIPKLTEDLFDQGFDKFDFVEIKVFKQVR